jgi:predicted metal-dependent phosphoesterase TrpH
MDKYIDLHIHTKFSDGECSPEEIIDMAIENKVSAVAITDHDCINGVKVAINYAKEKLIEIIPAVELSTELYLTDTETAGIKKLHIVGLYIDIDNMYLLTALHKVQTTRNKYYENIINKINTLFLTDASCTEMISYVKCNNPSKYQIADYFVYKNVFENKKDAIQSLFAKNSKTYVPFDNPLMSTQQAISIIHDTGGITIWAHPLNDIAFRQLNK